MSRDDEIKRKHINECAACGLLLPKHKPTCPLFERFDQCEICNRFAGTHADGCPNTPSKNMSLSINAARGCLGCAARSDRHATWCGFSGESPTVTFDWTKAPHENFPHYYRDVSRLQRIDVYRILQMFDVKNSCIQHAIKKLLVSGGRGPKDVRTDIEEAIQTLRRALELISENSEQ